MTSPVRGRARRRLAVIALAIVIAAAALVAALPWVLALGIAQRGLGVAANKIMAPGSVGFTTVRLSWFQPTEITNLVLRDSDAKPLITTPHATFEWSLWQILFQRPQSATLTIDQGDLDIARHADGTIDLYETLRPVISERPRVRLLIKIPDGRLRFRDPAFPEPVTAEKAVVDLDLGRDLGPINCKIELANGGADVRRLALEADYSRAEADPAGRHDLRIALDGSRWPWTLANAMFESRGELSGRLRAEIQGGRTAVAGDLSVDNLVAIGPALASDTVHLDKVSVTVDVHGSNGAWTIKQLDVTAPIGSLKGEGLFPPTATGGVQLEGSVDLAALAKQLPGTLHLRDDLRVERGLARLRASAAIHADGHTQNWELSGEVTDLVARQGQKTLQLPQPATLLVKMQHNQRTLTLERFDARTSFATATGQGDLEKGIALLATADLATLAEQCRDWIDLGGVELAGQAKLNATYRKQGDRFLTEGEATVDNLVLGGLPLVEKIERDRFTGKGKLSGPATALGLPAALSDASVQARTGQIELQLNAQTDAAKGDLTVDGRVKVPVVLSGRAQRIEAELNARSQGAEWGAERIALALVRDSRWGPGLAPDEAIRWVGTGRYDAREDRLVIESAAAPPQHRAEQEVWIYGDQKLTLHSLKAPAAVRLEAVARTDVAAIHRWLAPAGPHWTGRLDSVAKADRNGDFWNVGLQVDLRELAQSGGDRLDGDVTLALAGRYAAKVDRLELSQMSLRAPYASADGAGTLRGLTDVPVVDLKGTLTPEYQAIGRLLASRIEPQARIAGRPRAWRFSGKAPSTLALDQLGDLEGELGIQIDALDIFGMRLAQTPIVVRADDGRLKIDPIETTLNNGQLHLEPLVLTDKNGATWLRLDQSSSLRGAVVNDEVSHRVLSFVAPVLDDATRVDGRVSVRLADAWFPLSGAPKSLPRVEGDVLFDQVRFMPGPFAEELFSVFQKERKPLAVLRDPITVRIAGRKIYQQGLSIPVANLVSVGLDGSVDFDRNLDMVAHFGLVPPRNGVPVLSSVMQAARFDLPIGGTLDHPKINGEALKEHWKGIGENLLGNSLEFGAGALDRLLQGLPVPQLGGLIPPLGRRNAARQAPAPPPPNPVAPGAADEPDADSADTRHEVRKPPSRTQPEAKTKPAMTPLERQKLREQRKQERLAKKAARRQQRNEPEP
jgi:translocation and assembly module TamB